MKGSVLIIDADPRARMKVETVLHLRGLVVRSGTGALDASDAVQHDDVSVVVLDVSSPGMHGFEILRQLRGRFGQLRIVVTTDWEEPAVEHLARRLGADAFLRKPISPGSLIRTVEELVVIAAPRFGLRAG